MQGKKTMYDFKSYRKYELKYFIFTNIVIMILIKTWNNSSLEEIITANWLGNINKILSFSILSIVIYIVIFLIDSLIPGDIKWNLVYFHGRRPAEVIFEEIKKEKEKDARYSVEQLEARCKKIYELLDKCDEKEKYKKSTSEWYRLFTKYENKEKITNAKRDYVITRDMYISILFLAAFSIIVKIFAITHYVTYRFIVVEIVEILLLRKAVKARGKRLCRNVVAVHIASK